MLLLQNSENIQPTFYCRKEFFPGAPHHCAVSGFGSTGVNPPGIPLHRHPVRFELLLAAKVCLKCTMFGYCQRMKLGNHNTNTQSCGQVHARLCLQALVVVTGRNPASGASNLLRHSGEVLPKCSILGNLFLPAKKAAQQVPERATGDRDAAATRAARAPAKCLPICSPAQKIRVQVA